jgi:Zn-dependent protease
VWIDHGNIRSRRNRSLVSLAGPVVNVLFGVACIVPVAAGVFDRSPTLAVAIAYLGWLEFATATLNLLPVPGLDGYGIVEPYLPHAVRAFVNPYAHYAILILLVLMITTSFGTFVFQIADAATAALGVDPNILVHDGRLIANVQLL